MTLERRVRARRLHPRTVKGWERIVAASAPFGYLGACAFVAAVVSGAPALLLVTAVCGVVVGALFWVAGTHPWHRQGSEWREVPRDS